MAQLEPMRMLHHLRLKNRLLSLQARGHRQGLVKCASTKNGIAAIWIGEQPIGIDVPQQIRAIWLPGHAPGLSIMCRWSTTSGRYIGGFSDLNLSCFLVSLQYIHLELHSIFFPFFSDHYK